MEKQRDFVEKVLKEGADKARYYASKTMRKVRRKTGLTYGKGES